MLLLILASLSFAATVSGHEFFASPRGTPNGDGSFETPWDLQTALNQTSKIRPGDILWLRGGRYVYPVALYHGNTGFLSTLKGTPEAPIIVRGYRSEHAAIDGHGMFSALSVYSSYVWYWGFEVLDSAPARMTGQAFDFGIGVYGPGNKFINMVVHDTSEGFSAFLDAPNTEIYGSLIYYNGFINSQSAERVNFGHGIYLQNATGLKTVEDNIVFDNAGYGIQLYGSLKSSLVGFRLNGNTVFNNSSWAGLLYGYNFIIANAGERRDIQLRNNYTYFPLTAKSGQNAFGLYTPGTDILLTNNVLVGGYNPVEMHAQSGPVTFTNNIVYATEGLALLRLEGHQLFQFNWNHNSYFGNNVFIFPGGTGTFAQWQNATGFDSTSTFIPSGPATNWVYVRPNRYEPKRANIVVYNWSGADHVSVDLSGVFASGDLYVVQDAQDFYGPPVVQGVYSGGLLDVPLSSTGKAPLRGYPTPAHTDRQFQVFVALLAGATSPPELQVVMEPLSATLGRGAKKVFHASVIGAPDTRVTWAVTPKIGIISADGTYIAPAKIEAAGPVTVTVTATSMWNRSVSARAIITLEPPPTPVAGTSVITPQKLGMLRNNYSGWVGMQVAVSSPVEVQGIGRLCISGNTQRHALKIVDAFTGADLPGGQTTVFMGSCSAGQFIYGSLSAALTLRPRHSYYIVSQEFWNGDQWYDFDSTVQAGKDLSVLGAVYGNWTTLGTAGHTYGPLDLKVSTPSSTPGSYLSRSK